MTYNVHACKGRDGVISPRRIAGVIASAAPDVVALQELDVGRARSGKLDQAELIARELGMRFHFSPAMRVLEEAYGDAILTALPMRLVKAGALPGDQISGAARAARRAVDRNPARAGAAADDGDASRAGPAGAKTAGGRTVRGGVAHAIPTAAIRQSSPATSISCHARAPMPASRRGLQDAQRLVSRQPHDATFPARYPRFRIDYVFVSHGIQVDRVETDQDSGDADRIRSSAAGRRPADTGERSMRSTTRPRSTCRRSIMSDSKKFDRRQDPSLDRSADGRHSFCPLSPSSGIASSRTIAGPTSPGLWPRCRRCGLRGPRSSPPRAISVSPGSTGSHFAASASRSPGGAQRWRRSRACRSVTMWALPD